jgi:hypothetical protein
MNVIWTNTGAFRRSEYNDEADLEAAIVEVQADLFGASRIYLDVKKKIGVKGGARNIPDGYVLDLSGRKPRLYVVENAGWRRALALRSLCEQAPVEGGPSRIALYRIIRPLGRHRGRGPPTASRSSR